jgi:hypothetical protein
MYPPSGVISKKEWTEDNFFGLREFQYSVRAQTKMIVRAELSDELDYALIELTNAPDAAIDILNAAPVKGDEITIFSHPEERPLDLRF